MFGPPLIAHRFDEVWLADAHTSILKKTLLTVATGYILFYFSELAFWAKYDPQAPEGMTFPDVLLTLFAYSVLAFIFLSVIQRFRVRSVWALFLAGALYGWLGEGVLVQTMYEDLPMSLSFTGLAWHALISVLVGWYLIRKVLLENSYRNVLLLSSVIGALYGLWAIFWWLEPGHRVVPLSEFSAYTFITTTFLIASYWIYDAIQPFSLHTSRIAAWVLGSAIAVLFALGTLRTNPFALFILPPLLVVLYLALLRNHAVERRADLLSAALGGKARAGNYALLLCIPIIATTLYGIALSLHLRLPTHVFVYLSSTIGGAAMFMLSMVRIFTARPASGTTSPPSP